MFWHFQVQVKFLHAVSCLAGRCGRIVCTQRKRPPTALLPTVLCTFWAGIFGWKEVFVPGDAPGWLAAPMPSCFSWGRICGSTHPHATASVSFQSSRPKCHGSFSLPCSPLSRCFGTRAAVQCTKWSVLSLRTTNFLQILVFCPSPKRNHELLCRQDSFSRPIQASRAVASGGRRQWYEQVTTLLILDVI